MDQLQFLEDVLVKCLSFQDGHQIVGGDLNCIADRSLDRFANALPHPCSKFTAGGKPVLDSGLNALLASFRLVDAWRHYNPLEWDYTFFSYRHISYTRIDYVLISPLLASAISAANIDIRS